jgi:transposase InsO family protein
MIINSVPAAKYPLIQETLCNDNNRLNIKLLCEIAGVSRSGYYYWLSTEKDRIKRQEEDDADFAIILDAFKFRGYDKGSRGIQMRLIHLKPPILMNRKKIQRLMRKYNLYCPIRRANPYRKMAKALKEARAVPNTLNREFKKHGPRAVLLSDITYIPRRGGKYTYLCVIMDAFTKQVLAYVISLTCEADFVLETVNMLMEKYGSELTTDVLFHTDQGCQYTSYKFRDILKSFNIRQSMSRKANCWDNAPQESFFGHMKSDIRLNPSDAASTISRKIHDWIDYYNKDRYQWTLAKLSPDEFCEYYKTGIYPLQVPPPENAAELLGALPQTPEFIALHLQSDEIGTEKGDDFSPSPITP